MFVLRLMQVIMKDIIRMIHLRFRKTKRFLKNDLLKAYLSIKHLRDTVYVGGI